VDSAISQNGNLRWAAEGLVPNKMPVILDLEYIGDSRSKMFLLQDTDAMKVVNVLRTPGKRRA
jgi:hypothetical protein